MKTTIDKRSRCHQLVFQFCKGCRPKHYSFFSDFFSRAGNLGSSEPWHPLRRWLIGAQRSYLTDLTTVIGTNCHHRTPTSFKNKISLQWNSSQWCTSQISSWRNSRKQKLEDILLKKIGPCSSKMPRARKKKVEELFQERKKKIRLNMCDNTPWDYTESWTRIFLLLL